MILICFKSISVGQILTTDRLDYPPGDTVIISGNGFLSQELVGMQVLHADTSADNTISSAHLPWQITADINGNFQTSWVVPFDQDELYSTLKATADGGSSGLHAEVLFTDAAKCIQSVAAAGAQTICQNATATALTLTITSGGSGSPVSPTYQWFSNVNNNTTTGTSISGATSSTYLPPTVNSGVLFYYCIVTNTNGAGTCSGGSNISNTISITVNPAPTVANAGPDQSVCTTTATLAGNNAIIGNGVWSLVSGAGTITTINSPTSGITGLGSGVNIFKWTISSGTCTNSDNINITLNTAPVISLSSTSISKSASHGLCSAPVTYSNASATGSPAPVITYSPLSGSTFLVGQTTVTATATNTCGISSATFTVTVTDDEKPTATPPPTVTKNTDAGQCYASNVNLGIPVTSDNCGIQSITNNAPANFPVGTTTVTWTVTDLSGNQKNPTQLVTITDNEAPSALTKNVTVQLNSSGTGSIVAADINNSSSDPCGIKSLSASKTNFSCSDLGTNNVTLTVTDNNNNVSTATAIVTVADTLAPKIICPSDKTVNCDASSLPAITGIATATDNCDNASVITSSDASTQNTDVANVGHYNYTITRTWKAMDASENFSVCNQIITVSDTTKPVISCPPNKTINCDASQLPASTGVATATDNCDNAPAITSNDVTTQNTDATNIAHYNYTITRTWKAMDVAGNFSVCNQIITVSDTTKPVINCPPNKTINCDASQLPASTGVANAIDNCDNAPAITSSDASTQNADASNVAHYNYTITRSWKAMDVAGNFSVCNQIITVSDTTKPVISCPPNKTINCDASQLPASTGVATASDNCDNAPAITSSDASTQNADAANVAHYNYAITRTWKAMDVAGNFSVCNQIITVRDTTRPVISCPANKTINCDASQLPANTGVATATDNCDNAPAITSSDASTQNADAANVAHYNYTITRTWKAKDVAGNFSVCNQIITVRDTTRPVISCPPNKTIDCDASSLPASMGVATATDNCDNAPAITSSDASTQNADATNVAHYNYAITRTWKAMDVAGNFSVCNQIITVRDTTKPVIACPLTDSVYRHLDPYSITYTIQGSEFNATATDNCSPVTLSYSLYGATTGTGTSLGGVQLNNGKNTVKWTAKDVSGNLKKCYFYINVGVRPTTLTIKKPTPVVAAQYSDSIPLQAELVDYDGLKVHGKSVVFQVGTQILPAISTDINGLASTKIKLNQDPNTTTSDNVKATFVADASYGGSTDTDPFDVTREDACGVYNGILFANTNSETGGSATVRLKVVVTEASDGSSGDVRLATVAFTVLDGSTTILSSAPANLDPVSTSTQAVFYKDVTISLSSTELSKTLDVSWAIAGYYTDANCSEKNTQVTVSAPAPDFVTGGGFEILRNSSGRYPGDAGSKNNFGFSVKWNKNLTSIQGGGINSIIRKSGHLYQMKGNKVTYLNVIPKTATSPGKAVFYCNAVIKDITNPLDIITMEGNATTVIEITDAGEPGSNGTTGVPDSIAITVRDKNGALWFSSNWNGSKTLKQALDGGNIQVRSAASRSFEAIDTSLAVSENASDNEQYVIKIFPNPSDKGKIQVSILGYEEGKKPVQLYIFDVSGKLMYSNEAFCSGDCKEKVLTLDGRYSAGTYLIDIVIEGKIYHQKFVVQ